MARCPAHDDRNPSLSINQRDGKWLLHCHAGCTPGAVCDAVGLKVHDLFETPAGPHIKALYDYTDEKGNLLFQTVRYEPKDFKQRRPDGNGGWTWKLGDVRRVLY